jgi:predicted  nucleic acid-binding Zn-ribbon protein
MMNRSQALYRLQVVELGFAESSHRLIEVEDSLGETDELRQARHALEEGEKELARGRKELRALELEAKSLAEKISSAEGRLYSGRVRNPKELTSLEEEVKYLKRRKSKLEDEMLEAMVEIEEGEADIARLEEEFNQTETDWRQDQGRLSSEKGELKAGLSQLEKERAALRQIIGADDLALYDELCGRKGGRGVALLRGGVCQGCGVALPTGKAQQISQGEALSTCGSCGRILCAG